MRMAGSANPVQGLGLTLWLPDEGVWPVAVDLVVVPCLALGVAVAHVHPVAVPVPAPDPVPGHAVAVVVPAGVVIAREVVAVRGVAVARDHVAVVQHLVAPDRVADQGLVLGQGLALVQCPGLDPVLVPAVAPGVVVQDPVVSVAVVPGPGHAVAVALGQVRKCANRRASIESNPTRRTKELPR